MGIKWLKKEMVDRQGYFEHVRIDGEWISEFAN